MKKFTSIFIILFFSTTIYGQLLLVNESKMEVENSKYLAEENWAFNLKSSGCVFVNKIERGDSKKMSTWSFTLLDDNSNIVWTKKIDLDLNLKLSINANESGIYGLGYFNTSMNSNLTNEIYLLKVTLKGDIEQKTIQLKTKVEVGTTCFFEDMCYLDTYIRENCTILKFDFSTLSISENSIPLPENTSAFDCIAGKENVYYRVRSTSLHYSYDAIYTIHDGVVITKTKMERSDSNDIATVSVINTDSVHSFVLISKIDENINKKRRLNLQKSKLYLANMEDFNNNKLTMVATETSDTLLKNRENLKEDRFPGYNGLRKNESKFIISSSIRIQNKNILVFNKSQEAFLSNHHSKSAPDYLFTNIILWCVTDDGNIEWTKNIECEYVSPFLESKVVAVKHNDSSFVLVGYFNSNISTMILSSTGEILKEEEEAETPSLKGEKFDFVGYSIFSNTNNSFTIWGLAKDDRDERKELINYWFKTIDLKP